MVAPVAAVRVDEVLAENLAGVAVNHSNGVGIDEDGHGLVFVGGADAEVVHAAGAAEADLAEAVDVVIADAVVRVGVVLGWDSLDGGGVGLRRRSALEGSVRPDLVIDASEGVHLGLQFGDSGGCWLSSEPAFQGLVEAFDLALGLGMAGMAVLLRDAEAGQQIFKAVPTAGEAGGIDRAVVGEGGLWQAVSLGGGQKVVITVWPLTRR